MPTATSRAADESRISSSLGARLFGWAIVLALITSPAGRAAESRAMDENWDRLRSIPREQRLALWEKLKKFDALSRTERSTIRSLDERIAQLPPSDRANYLSVLRRYHHWVQGLTEAQRNELNSVPPGERMRLITKLRAEDRTSSNGDSTPLFLKVIDFSPMFPHETAHRLKAWFGLGPEKRAEIEKIPAREDRQKRLAELSPNEKGGAANRLTKGEEEALLAKIESNPQLKNWLASPLKKADPTKHEKVRRRMAANYYFIEHPPAPVEESNLMRFAAALPSWYREQYDHLPPEEARRRLTILYRLVFPGPGEEMPVSRKATNPQGKAAAPPRPPGPGPGAATGVNPY
jgi:hypothetical protein